MTTKKLPNNLKNFKIVQISDLHFDGRNNREFERLRVVVVVSPREKYQTSLRYTEAHKKYSQSTSKFKV